MIDREGSIAGLRAIWNRGPGMHKNPEDLVRYQRVINRVKPKVVVETGLYYGGSQLWFAERVPHVINVELNTETTADYRANRHGLGFPPANGHIVEGNSHEVFDEVAALTKELAGDGPVMVVLDSDHGTNTVYGEMVRYGQLVTPGSYMIVEDGILHYLPVGPFLVGNWFDGDPVIAIERYLAEQCDFVLDEELEDMLPTTQHPMGWLVKGAPRAAVLAESGASSGGQLVPAAARSIAAPRNGDSGRLDELERENARLKRIVVEQALDMEILKELGRGES